MTTVDDRPTREPDTRPTSSERLRRYAERRGRQLRYLALGLLGVTIAVVAIAWVYRSTCLWTLPDPGDPFDLSQVESAPLPDSDAFEPLWNHATLWGSFPSESKEIVTAGPGVAWSQAHPKLKAWFEANRSRLDDFTRAASRPNANPRVVDINPDDRNYLRLTPFLWLALLDASRLSEQGDMAAAWDRYASLLKMKAHLMRRGTAGDREIATLELDPLSKVITAWAAHPRTTPREIRHALHDLDRFEPRPEWDVESLRLDYQLDMITLQQPGGLFNDRPDQRLMVVAGQTLPPSLAELIHDTQRFLVNEPERSRRVVRLVHANWLVQARRNYPDRKPPSVVARFDLWGDQGSVALYPDDRPAAPDPTRLARWITTAADAQWLLTSFSHQETSSRRERRQHRAMLIALASELYRREKGHEPPTEESLLGTYLDHLPDDGAHELDDGSATIIDDRASQPPPR